MKRRHFIALSAVSLPVAAKVQAEEIEQNWWEDIVNITEFTARSEEGNLTLAVELEVPAEGDVTKLPEGEGEYTGYSYKGKNLPLRYWPGCSLIKKFDFKWDGEPIEIEKRFWDDLAGLVIEKVPQPDKKTAELFAYQDFLQSLKRPRVMKSADGGTALIEWVRSEECDSSSTTRWIVSRRGNVLRHRHEPPHEC